MFPKTEPCTFQSKLEKQKNPGGENLLHFRKQKHWKNLSYFSKKNAPLIFRETETPKNFFIF